MGVKIVIQETKWMIGWGTFPKFPLTHEITIVDESPWETQISPQKTIKKNAQHHRFLK